MTGSPREATAGKRLLAGVNPVRVLARAASAVLIAGGALVGCSAMPPVASSHGARSAAPSATPKTVDPIDAHVVFTGKTVSGTDVMGAFGSIWAVNHHGASVSRIDPATNATLATIPVGFHPGNLFQGLGAVWIYSAAVIWRIDPSTNAVTSFTAPVLCGVPAILGDQLWAYGCGIGSVGLYRIDLTTHVSTAVLASNSSDGSVVIANNNVWFSDGVPGRIRDVDPATGAVLATLKVAGCPYFQRQALIDGQLWVGQEVECPIDNNDTPGGDSGKIFEINPATSALEQTVNTHLYAPTVADDASGAWVSSDSGQIQQLDTQTGKLTPYSDLNSNGGVAFEADFGALWAVSFNDSKLWRIAEP